jgi:dihydroorotate dehydrogenase electron transfer subunit
MKGLHDCEIIEQTQIGPGVLRTRLKGPEIAREAQAGQFLNIRVAECLDPLLRRPFSVHATYPDEGVFSLLYVVRGRGTKLLEAMQPGTRVSVVGPLGKGFDLGDSSDAEHVVVAGGCGAAPLHFLCDALCKKWDCSRVTVLAGAQCKDAVLCEAEFKSHGVEVGISTDDGSYGHHGFVTQLFEQHLRADTRHPSPVTRVYSCGPHAMLKEVARISREHGAASCQVSLENNMACGMGVCMGCVQKIRDSEGWHYERVCKDGPVFEAEDVIWE